MPNNRSVVYTIDKYERRLIEDTSSSDEEEEYDKEGKTKQPSRERWLAQAAPAKSNGNSWRKGRYNITCSP